LDMPQKVVYAMRSFDILTCTAKLGIGQF